MGIFELGPHWVLVGCAQWSGVFSVLISLIVLPPTHCPVLDPQAFNSETDNFKLTYGGHQYHASCANFWINCVEPKPPALILPDLL